MRWIKTKSGKWKLLREDEKTYDYYQTKTYSKKLRERLKSKFLYCKVCESDYSLADPCAYESLK